MRAGSRSFPGPAAWTRAGAITMNGINAFIRESYHGEFSGEALWGALENPNFQERPVFAGVILLFERG